MDAITDLFLFNGATFISLLLRITVLGIFTAFILYVVYFIWLRFYNKEKEPSFILFANKAYLYSICVVVFFISFEWYYLINVNGTHWFKWNEFPLSLLNIYLLLLPELAILGVLFALFFINKNKIKNNL